MYKNTVGGIPWQSNGSKIQQDARKKGTIIFSNSACLLLGLGPWTHMDNIHIAHSCFHAAAPTSSQVIKVLCISFSSFLDYKEDLLLSWNYQNPWLYILTLCVLSFHQVTYSQGCSLCLSLVASNTGQEARKAHLKNVVNGTKPDLTAK